MSSNDNANEGNPNKDEDTGTGTGTNTPNITRRRRSYTRRNAAQENDTSSRQPVNAEEGKSSDNGKRKATSNDSTLGKRRRNAEFSCSYCGKGYHSMQAVFGHMRFHKDRPWRGAYPPPVWSAAEEDAAATAREKSVNGGSENAAGLQDATEALLILATHHVNASSGGGADGASTSQPASEGERRDGDVGQSSNPNPNIWKFDLNMPPPEEDSDDDNTA